jgi:hypothetical protein
LLDAVDIRDPESMPFFMRAYRATDTLVTEFVNGMPLDDKRSGSVWNTRQGGHYGFKNRLEDHLASSRARARQQAGEAWLEVAKRWAGFEAVVLLEEEGDLLKELFEHRWENYTQHNQAYLLEQAQLKAEADRIEEAARLAEVERLEAPKRLAAEKAAASAASLREQFDTLLTTKGPALLKALERLVAEEPTARASQKEARS